MLRLEKSLKSDLTSICAIESEAENLSYILPYSYDRHFEVLHSKDEEHLKVLNSENQLVGFVILAGIANPHKCIEFRRIVITEKGKGYGTEAVNLIKNYCFTQLKCHRLWLDALEDNVRARNLYKRAGFTEEGILRECILSPNGYRSLIVMSLLEGEHED